MSKANNNNVFGECTDYGNNNTSTKLEYIKLTNGKNLVRILSKPFTYYMHSIVMPGDTGWGKFFRCANPTGKAGVVCPACSSGNEEWARLTQHWLFWALERRTGEVKALDVKYGIFASIKSLALDEDWGDPTKYDVNIKVDKNAPPTGYYTVIPQTKKPLTAVEQKMQDEIDLDALLKRCQPPAQEGALKYFQKLTGGVVETTLAEAKAEAERASSNKVEAANGLPVSLADDSLDGEFPDYQTSK